MSSGNTGRNLEKLRAACIKNSGTNPRSSVRRRHGRRRPAELLEDDDAFTAGGERALPRIKVEATRSGEAVKEEGDTEAQFV